MSCPVASTSEHPADHDLLDRRWDLTSLLDGDGSEMVERLLDDAASRATVFTETFGGRVAELDAPGLVGAMRALAAINELTGRVSAYGELRFSADTTDAAAGALAQRAQERSAEIESKLLFFELEWLALEEERVDALLQGAGRELDFAARHLRRLRLRRPHRLSTAEETILAQKSVPSRDAWVRLFNESAAAVQVDLGDEPATVEAAVSLLAEPDRTIRRRASDALAAGLASSLRTKAFVFNTLMYEKAIDDRLRSYPHWLASRNLENEASDESVQALIEAVRGRLDIPQRWYQLKARILGLERLADYDLMAPLVAEDAWWSFRDARELVIDTYQRFSAQAGAIVQRFFDERWIDAPPIEGKRGGAFCHPAVPSAHPYILLNYTGRAQDVIAMAHELGHGIHSVLSASQGIFHHLATITVAETASGFGEALVAERLLAIAPDDQHRLALLGWRLDNTVLVTWEAIAAHRFEDLAHTRRRRGYELSVEQLADLWTETLSELYGDAVEVTERGRVWWSFYPHFVNYPGYVYAYAYGQLLAVSAYARYRQAGEPFSDRFLAMLAAGSSRSPEQLAEIIGVDLADPTFWAAGLQVIDEQVNAAAELAEKLGA
jgi:oligoendopeptidase F